MDSMKEFKTFEEWQAKYLRAGDPEKFRKIFEEVHGAPKRRGRPRKKVEDETED